MRVCGLNRHPHMRTSNMPRTAGPSDSPHVNKTPRRHSRPLGTKEDLELLKRGDREDIRVLVVDDESTIRESCAAVLRQDGYQVTLCSRGQEAVDMLAHRRFHIILA